MSHVLIVDDEPSICWSFREFLTDDGHDVSIASSAEEALQIVERVQPDAVVLDVRLPGMDGLTALSHLRKAAGDVPIIVITAFGDLQTAVRTVQEGAFEYLPKPFDLDRAAEIVRRALDTRQSSEASTAGTPDLSDDLLIGSSPLMQQVFKQIALVSASDVPVLITGESGTGKELVARAIHEHSGRRGGPFLPICLAALSSGVVESELFGHVKGAFTGATHERPGLLKLAEGGTVLLDEIADTEPGMQVKLLRALEQQEITPVGDARPRPFDARVLAATNRPLAELIRDGIFREDLFFRLSVFEIRLPALRDRTGDIPNLARHFLRRVRSEPGGDRIDDDVIAELESRHWPGNVRELRNVMEHAAIASRGNPIRLEHLPVPSETPADNPDSAPPLNRLIEEWTDAAIERITAGETPDSAARHELYEEFLAVTEPALLAAVLRGCGGNKAAAAQLLGMHRTTLRQKLRRRGLDSPD